MTDGHRLRWLIFAILGFVLAVCLWLGAVSASVPEALIGDVVPMDKVEVGRRQTYDHAEVPIQPQAVPDPASLDADRAGVLAAAQYRADWVGGAVVTCDIGDLIPSDIEMTWESEIHGRSTQVTMGMQSGLNLNAPVDMLSQVHSIESGGRISFVVREPQGTATIGIPRTPTRGTRYETEQRTAFLKVSWAGAEPGTTVGCHGVAPEPEATLVLTVLVNSGPPADGPSPLGWGEHGVMISGCGYFFWYRNPSQDPIRLTVPSGACELALEHRNRTFPLIVTRGPKRRVHLSPGQVESVTMRAPPMPPLYFPPDADELEALADYAAMTQSNSVSGALDDLLDELDEGGWDPTWVEIITTSAYTFRRLPPNGEDEAE